MVLVSEAECHISLPKPFAGGEAAYRFQRFDIYSRANGWGAEAKRSKTTSLTVWLENSWMTKTSLRWAYNWQ